MALKRKEMDSASTAPSKKARTGATDDDCASDESDDLKIMYTDNGNKRAESEARRQWIYICSVESCRQRFNRPCRLESHMRSHNKERPFACNEPDCDKTFPRKDHLRRHIKNAHSDPATERTYACQWEGCGKSFTSNGRLQRHVEVHESKFYCTEFPPCREVFRKEKSLVAHVKSQHLQVKPYPCTFVDPATGEQCMSGFQTEGTLRRHMTKAHLQEQETGLFCMLCPSFGSFEEEDGDTIDPLAFETVEELEAHVAEFHPPMCDLCGQRFKSPGTLKSHLDTVHVDRADQPQYPCPHPDCDSIFNRKHNLTVHVQSVHEKQCKFFCTADALQHSKHEDLKNWSGANACGAAFKAKSSLDQHVRTHHLGLGTRKQLRKAAKSRKKIDSPSMLTLLTGVGYEQGRQVSCLLPDCAFRFFMDRDLRRHMRAAHNLSNDEIEEKILERDALTGGQFWIGGVDNDDDDDLSNMLDSQTPSMPQTPYYVDNGTPLPPNAAAPLTAAKGAQPHFNPFDQTFDHLSLLTEEAEMDAAMGLGSLAPATDAHEGLLWDALAPVEQYNCTHE
ncbi:hypothetical protein ACN47E_009071 [Coniothyrium glycines]